MKLSKIIFITSFFTLLLFGCSSMDDISQDTESIVKEEFSKGGKGVNAESTGFIYYIPEKMNVENETNHNIILTQEDQTYILFVNELEKQNSRVIYESNLLSNQEYIVNQTFEDKEKFGFVQVVQVDEKLYEVCVGVGGVKLTTETTKKEIVKSAKKMMIIANSVRVKALEN